MQQNTATKRALGKHHAEEVGKTIPSCITKLTCVLKQELSSRDADGVAYKVRSCRIKPWSSECATDQQNNTRKLREKPMKASMRIGIS